MDRPRRSRFNPDITVRPAMKPSLHSWTRLVGRRCLRILLLPWLVAIAGCGPSGDAPPSPGSGPSGTTPTLTFGVAFETLQTEAWVAAWERLKSECSRNNAVMLEAVADGDANRQLEQVKTFISRKVDGLIIVPKDAKTVIPMIKAANAASIPVVLFNRPSDPTDAPHTVIAPDNFSLAKETVNHLITLARKTGAKQKAMILMGDLGDINAIGRRDGFEAAVLEAGDAVEVVSRIPTEWNQEKALAGVQSALQLHPDIGLIFTSSDFMFPSIKSVLSSLGRWKKSGEPGHVILGGFDGDATAYQWLKEGYVDATGVQDFFWEAEMAVKVLVDATAGKPTPDRLDDKGFTVNQENLAQLEDRMWGAVVAKQR